MKFILILFICTIIPLTYFAINSSRSRVYWNEVKEESSKRSTYQWMVRREKYRKAKLEGNTYWIESIDPTIKSLDEYLTKKGK